MNRANGFGNAWPLLLLLGAAAAQAQTIAREDLAAALRSGGYVIVMRHASSPREAPDAETADADNVNRERQLDDTGRRDAAAMGEALRKLEIPIGRVLSSPTYRALQTARLMGFEDVRAVDELGNEGMRTSGEAYAAWLRANVAMRPAAGNRLLITHGPNLAAAFPEEAQESEEGEALVFRPAGEGRAVLVARLEIADWPRL
jgi:phosphohistidine phosphatase SixA